MNKPGSAQVLVVDDERCVRDLVARWLTAEGYQCAGRGHARCVGLPQGPSGRAGHTGRYDARSHGPQSVARDDVELPGRGGHYGDRGGAGRGSGRGAHPRGVCVPHEAVFARRARPPGEAGARAPTAHDRRGEHHRHLEEKVREQTGTIRRTQEEIIHRLVSASLYRDTETGMHIRRVGLVSEVLAEALGWSVGEAENLRIAAPMHDVGKMGIPDAVLSKPGALTPEEAALMRTHTLIGAKILAGSDSPLLKMAAEIALSHHERWDGSGYPAGLAGLAIPETAHIVAVANVYDALVSARVYRRALPEEEALAIMQGGAGTQFDSAILALFFRPPRQRPPHRRGKSGRAGACRLRRKRLPCHI